MNEYKLISDLKIEISPLIKAELELNLISALVAVVEDHGGTLSGSLELREAK